MHSKLTIKMKKCIIILFILLFSDINAQYYSSETLKSIFVVKFIQFVDWPNNYFDNKDSFTIVLFSQKKVSKEAIYNIKKQKLKGKPVNIIKTTNFSTISKADAIFIFSDQKTKLKEINKKTKDHSTLIITDFGKIVNGGKYHFGLYTTPNFTIMFNINPELLSKSNLTPDIGLLEMGNIVKN